MKHFHFKLPGVKAMSHSHDGGEKRHSHPSQNLKGYRRTRDSLKIRAGDLPAKVRSKAKQTGMGQLASDIVGYAVVTQVMGLIR